MFNMKMFVETDPDSRLAKRLYKETEELGRDLDQVDYSSSKQLLLF